MILGTCHLCSREANLELSHIVPKFVKFVIRWLKTSGGHMRATDRPNVRTQDGPKRYLLCRDCEELFQKWETPFAERVFKPLHGSEEARPNAMPYEEWALRFAVSVSWRSLTLFAAHERFSQLTLQDRDRIRTALGSWAQFLRAERPHPGEFEQHLVWLSGLKRASPPVSPFFNRYILQSVDLDLAQADEAFFVYTKLGRVMIFGLIPRRAQASGWSNITKIRARKGEISLRGAIALPQSVMEFINDRANKAQNRLASMSSIQREKVTGAVLELARSHPDAELFRAWRLDYDLGEREVDGEDRDA